MQLFRSLWSWRGYVVFVYTDHFRELLEVFLDQPKSLDGPVLQTVPRCTRDASELLKSIKLSCGLKYFTIIGSEDEAYQFKNSGRKHPVISTHSKFKEPVWLCSTEVIKSERLKVNWNIGLRLYVLLRDGLYTFHSNEMTFSTVSTPYW